MKKYIILLLFLQYLCFGTSAQTAGYSEKEHRQTRETSGISPDSPANDSVSFYDIGGHLFAGQYPINNPFFAGDTGIVYLYRIKDNQVIPVDTALFFNLGYFVFPQVMEGKYIIKGRLTEKSTSFPLFFPTYLTGEIKWNSSDVLELLDRSIYEANIHMVLTTETFSGPASLKGYVVQETAGQIFKPMANTEVILYSEKMDPLTYCFSDAAGLFYFPDLPYGTYNLMAESTGKYPAILKITLDPNHTTIDSLLLETMMHNPATIEVQTSPSQGDISPVFPDPATDRINVIIKSKEPQRFNFSIFAFTGEKMISLDQIVSGVSTVTIPIVKLQDGLYFLKIISEDARIKMVRRWIKL